MSQLESLLDELRSRLRAADFKGLAALAPALETALVEASQDRSLPRDLTRLQRVKRQAEENGLFMEAARRGLRAARRRLEEVQRAQTGLQTYGPGGRVQQSLPPASTAGRF